LIRRSTRRFFTAERAEFAEILFALSAVSAYSAVNKRGQCVFLGAQLERVNVMSNQDDESERLRRLRDQQIRARKPATKTDKQLSKTATRRKDWLHYTLMDAIKDMPAKVLYMTIGGIFGLIVALVIVSLYKTLLATGVAIIFLLFSTLVGRVAGMVEDWRKQ
jgi:hypothetical protein